MNTGALNIITPNESGDSKTNNLNPSSVANTSHEPRKYRGVFPAGRRFRAVMQLDGVRHNLGMHSTEIEAARAYDKFAREHCKKTNFPYPPRRDPAAHSTTSKRANSQNQLSTESNQTSGNYIFSSQSFSDPQLSQGVNPSPVTATTSTTSGPSSSAHSGVAHANNAQWAEGGATTRMYGATQPPLSYNKYDDSYSSYSAQQYQAPPHLAQAPMHSPVLSLQEDLQRAFWPQQSHLQHQQHMLEPQWTAPYSPLRPTAPQMAHHSHPVVYVPVPLSISNEVSRYVNDYLRLEQHQQYGQTSFVHRAPIFMPQQTPFPPRVVPAQVLPSSIYCPAGVAAFGQQTLQDFVTLPAEPVHAATFAQVGVTVFPPVASALISATSPAPIDERSFAPALTDPFAHLLTSECSFASPIITEEQEIIEEEVSLLDDLEDELLGDGPESDVGEAHAHVADPDVSESNGGEENEKIVEEEGDEKEEMKEMEEEEEEEEEEESVSEEESESDFEEESSGFGSVSESEYVAKRTRFSARLSVLDVSTDSAYALQQSSDADEHQDEDSPARAVGAMQPSNPDVAIKLLSNPPHDLPTVPTTKPVVKNKKRVRKSRKRVSAAEEARLAASHPAAPYIATIGPNPINNRSSSSGGASADAEAWRQQVRYHWHGTLLFDPERCVQVWRGTWLGTQRSATLDSLEPQSSSDGVDTSVVAQTPTPEAFAATETTFVYLSTKVRKHNVHQSAQDNTLVPQSGYFKGYFKMRSTKVKAYVKHPDHDFYIVFEPYAPGKDGLVHEYALYGRGMGEYGAFIVHGRYSNQTGFMQAVRVYLHEADDRAKMTLKQLQAWFQQGGSI